MARLAVAVLWLLAVTVRGAAAQEAAADLLPPAEDIGEGWAKIAEFPPIDSLSPAFSDAAYAVYGGPNGARAVVNAFLVAEGMTAIRQSWEIANSDFERYRSEIDYGFQFQREDELAALPMPAGCSDARRLYGTDTIGFQSFPVGLTLCAADPDVMLLIYASGEVNGFSGYEASDYVTELALGGSAEGPEAGA